jgi:hypothetical protein
METRCKNCGNLFQGQYCNNCGQKVIRERYTIKHLFGLIFESFNVERGLLYTIKLLFTNPGKLINDYLEGRTKDFYNPLKYLILIASINAVLMLWFDIFDTNVANTNELMGETGETTKLQQIILDYLKMYLNIFSLIVIPFYSLMTKWIFKKHKLFYAEHLVINSYLFAQYTLLQMVAYLAFSFIPGLSKLSMLLAAVIFISYYGYALRGVFNIKLLKSSLMSMLVFLGGTLLFYFFIGVVSIIVVIVLRLGGYDIKQMIQ